MVRFSSRFFPFILPGLLLFGCSPAQETAPAKLRVGLVFDVGGRGDKSFNDSAFAGIERAAKELGIQYEYIEPGDGSDRESALRQLAAGKNDLIFGIGFLFTDDIDRVAKDFPDKKFACIDYAVSPERAIAPNVSALKFREQEGSFLVGALAGLLTKTGTVGFIGGMDIPLIHKFEAGFKAGAAAAKPQVRVLTGYAGVTGEAFKNPAKGKAIALSQIGQEADILFHASGVTGLGVFEAAREKHVLSIGVDSDQYAEAPGFILTSMVKRVDVAIYKTVQDTLEGKFQGGIHELGLAEDGVGYVYDEHNKDLIPDSVIKKVEAMRRKIIAGKIQVPSTRR